MLVTCHATAQGREVVCPRCQRALPKSCQHQLDVCVVVFVHSQRGLHASRRSNFLQQLLNSTISGSAPSLLLAWWSLFSTSKTSCTTPRCPHLAKRPRQEILSRIIDFKNLPSKSPILAPAPFLFLKMGPLRPCWHWPLDPPTILPALRFVSLFLTPLCGVILRSLP